MDDLEASADRARNAKELSALTWDKCVDFGRKARSRSDHETAELYFAEAIKKTESFGPRDSRLLTSLEELADVYQERGHPDKAEPLLRRVSDMREKYPAAEQARDSGAFSYLAWEKCVEYGERAGQEGDIETARLYFESALEKAERFNPFDPRLPVTLTKLIYQKLGNRAKAEPLFKRVMNIHAGRLGSLHPDLISAKDELGRFYYEEGRFDEAFPLFSWDSYIEYGTQARKTGDLAKARVFFEEALKIAEKYDPKYQPYLVATLTHLAGVLREQSQVADAEKIMKRKLDLLIKNHGSSHPDVVTARDELGKLYLDQDRIDEALALLSVGKWVEYGVKMKQAGDLATAHFYMIKARKKIESLEPQDQRLPVTIISLADTYISNDNFIEAETFLKNMLHVRMKYLDNLHPNTIAIKDKLGTLYADRSRHMTALPLLFWDKCMEYGEKAKRKGDLALARSYYSEALKKTKTMKTNDPRLMKTLADLADVLNEQGLFSETELVLKKALDIQKKILWAKTFIDFTDIQVLDERGFFDLGRFLKNALDIPLANLDPSHPDVIALQDKLGLLYANHGMYDKALPLMSADKCIEYGKKAKQTGALATAQAYFIEAVNKVKQGDPLDPRLPATYAERARIFMEQDRIAEAEPLFKSALDLLLKLHEFTHPDVIAIQLELATIYIKQGQLEKADFLPLEKYIEYGDKAIQEGKHAQARKFFIEAIKKIEGSGNLDLPLAGVLNKLAGTYMVENKFSEAEPLFKRILSIHENGQPDKLAQVLNNLAGTYHAQNKFAEAEPLFKRALDIYIKLQDASAPDVIITQNNLALAYMAQSRYPEAEKVLKSAMANIRMNENPALKIILLKSRASLLQATKRELEAEAVIMEFKALGGA